MLDEFAKLVGLLTMFLGSILVALAFAATNRIADERRADFEWRRQTIAQMNAASARVAGETR